jgi:hypothetical protein
MSHETVSKHGFKTENMDPVFETAELKFWNLNYDTLWNLRLTTLVL